jgi:hypothetical protein
MSCSRAVGEGTDSCIEDDTAQVDLAATLRLRGGERGEPVAPAHAVAAWAAARCARSEPPCPPSWSPRGIRDGYASDGWPMAPYDERRN